MKQSADPAPEVRTVPLAGVIRAIEQQHTIAVILSHLVGHVAVSFRGNEVNGPAKLLRTLSGSARRAEVEDVLLVERMLEDLAEAARAKLARLEVARVVADDEMTPAGPLPGVERDREAVGGLTVVDEGGARERGRCPR